MGEVLAAGGELQQVPDPQALEPGGLLEAIADALPGAVGDGKAGDILAVPEDGAGGGLHQPHNGLRQRGLAAAVGAGDDHEFVIRDGKGDVVEDAELPAGFVGHLIG